MAYSLQNTTDLTNLGDAIRTKTSTTATMTVAEMATAVAGITSGGGSGWTPTTITDITDQAENGKYDASIDLTIHSLSPYIVVVVSDASSSNHPYLVATGYFDGTQCILLYGNTSSAPADYYSISFSQHNLSFENTVSWAGRDAVSFYIIT